MTDLDEALSAAAAGAKNSPEARVENSQRIERFVTRVLGEALRLGAESVTLTLDGEALTGGLQRAGAELKPISVSAQWFDPLYLWLRERRAAYLSADPEVKLAAPSDDSDITFTCAARLEGELATFSARRKLTLNKKHVISLSQFSRVPVARVFDQLAFTPQHRAVFERLAVGEGLVLICAPTLDMLDASLALTLSLTGAQYAGSALDGTAERILAELGGRSLVAVGYCADDVGEALFKARQSGLSFDHLPLRAALCQAFAAQVCPACARETAVDPKLLDELPPVLRREVGAGYRVGRGCDKCGQRGYRGRTVIAGVLELSQKSIGDIAHAASPDAMAAVLADAGVLPLLADGVQKLARGSLTFQSLYRVTRVLNASWIQALERRVHRQTEKAGPIEVDLFSSPSRSSPVRLSGKAAFSGNPADEETVKPKRDKPLLLVVEDDPDQRSILEMVFKSAEYEVALAGDGVEALERVRRDSPDLIVTDLMMPKMDGSELVKRLKADPAHREIPVLVLTVLSDANKEYSLLDLGAEDYCEKTIQRKILLKRVENLLRRAGA